MRQVDLDIRTAVGAPHCIVEATTQVASASRWADVDMCASIATGVERVYRRSK